MESPRVGLYFRNPSFAWFSISFFIFFFASKSLGLTLGYALDDYAVFGAAQDSMQSFLLSQGRFTFALLQKVMDLSGLKQPELAGLGFFMCAGGLLVISWFTLAMWLQKSLLLSIAIGALLGAHPFFAEYVSFRQSLFPTGICFLLVSCAAYLLAQESRLAYYYFIVPAALAAFASGITQLAMTFFCISALGIFLQKKSRLPFLSSLVFSIRDTALLGALASFFYLLIFGASKNLFDFVPSARMSVLGLSDVSNRIWDVMGLLVNIFDGTFPLIGPIAASCIGIAVFFLATHLFNGLERFARVITVFFLILSSLILALLPVTLSGTWWPMPRTLIAVPLALALAIINLSVNAGRTQVLIASCALLLSAVIFAGKSNALLIDQQRLNRWDIGLAREITLKASEIKKIDSSVPIVLHRTKWAYEIDRNMPIGDANVSALNVIWAVNPLFEEATGRKLMVTLGSLDDKTCNNVSSFPNPGSIFEVNGAIQVCL